MSIECSAILKFIFNKMGGRQLQKLLKERESLLQVEEDEQGRESAAAQSPVSSASSDEGDGAVFNPFSLLTGDEEHSEREACEEEEEEEE